MTTTRRAVAAIVAFAFFAAGCGGSDETSGSTTTAGGTESTTTTPSSPGDAVHVVEGSGTIVATDGGVLVSEDGLFALHVPAGALAQDTEFSVTNVESADLPGPLAGVEVRGAVHDVQPSGIEFATPATVLRWVDPQAVGFSATEARVINLVSASDDGEFEALGNAMVLDFGDDVLVSGTTDHLTDFLAMGTPNTGINTEALESVPLARDFRSLLGQLPPGPDGTVETTELPVVEDPNNAGFFTTVALWESLPGNTYFVGANGAFDEFSAFLPYAMLDLGDDVAIGDVLGGPISAPSAFLGRPAFCDVPPFAGGAGPAVVPLLITPDSDAVFPVVDVSRPPVLLLRWTEFDCADVNGPGETGSTGQSVGLVTATACVFHDPGDTGNLFLSRFDITAKFTHPVLDFSLTLSNGANNGEPVSVTQTDSPMPEASLEVGISQMTTYDVVEALAKGTDGETVDLTAAFQAALGSLDVGPTEGAVGNTPASACQ